MMPMHPANREARGFTLIELLVVIAIIAILATILIPNISSMMENSKASKCTVNLSEIEKALQIYSDRSRLPYAFRNPSIDTNANWAERIMPYVGDSMVFLCPSDAISRETGDRTYAVNAVRGSGKSLVPFGNSDPTSPMRLTDLSMNPGGVRLILISERPTENDSQRGRMDNDVAASLDLTPSTGHRKARFGNYLMSDGSVQLIENSVLTATQGYSNRWTYCTGN